MSELNDPVDVRKLVQWLGRDGASAGLEKSKFFSVKALRDIALRLGLPVERDATRGMLINAIVRQASKRITRSVDELMRMERNEIIEYFNTIDVESVELLDLLRELNIEANKDSHRALVELAARELSETGRFMRIAAKNS